MILSREVSMQLRLWAGRRRGLDSCMALPNLSIHLNTKASEVVTQASFLLHRCPKLQALR